MPHDPLFEQRIADALKAQGVKPEHKKMFGGVAFMVNGNMAVGITNKGDFMVRFDGGRHEEILAWPGAKPMTFGHKGVKGFLFVDADAVAGGPALNKWVKLSLEHVKKMPHKDAKARKGAAKKKIAGEEEVASASKDVVQIRDARSSTARTIFNPTIPMSKYMFLFRGGDASRIDAQADPQRWQAHMMKWKIWMDTLAAKGQMLGGEPLDKPGKVLTGRGKKITDGPFVEGREVVGGYLLVNAKDMNEAVEISKSCPIFEDDGMVEVRPVQELNM